MIKLEIKKIMKNGNFWTIFLLALILTIYGNFFSINMFDRQIDEAVGDFDFLYELVSSQDDHPILEQISINEYAWQGKSKEFNEDYTKIQKMKGDDEERSEKEIRYDFSYPAVNHDYINEIKNFINKYNLKLTKELEDKLSYYDVAYQYLDKNKVDVDKFLNDNYQSSANILFTNLNLYFGFIPCILLGFLLVNSIGDDYKKDNILLYFTEPFSRKRYLLKKITSFVGLGLFYSLLIFFFSFICGLIKKDINFLLDFPIRIYEYKEIYILFYQYLLKVLGLFIFKSLLIITLSSLIILIFKDNSIATIIQSSIFALLYIVTDVFDKLKNLYNPIYFTYDKFFLGAYELDPSLNGVSNNPLVYVGPRIRAMFFLIYLILIFVLLLISFRFLAIDKMIKLKHKAISRTKPMSIMGFEFYKSEKFLDQKIPYILGGFLIVVLISSNLYYVNNVGEEYFQADMLKLALRMSIENNKEEHFYPKSSYMEENRKEFEESSRRLEEYNNLEKLYRQNDPNFYKLLYETNAYIDGLDRDYRGNVFAEESVNINPLTLKNGDLSAFSKEVREKYKKLLLEKDLKPMKVLFNRSLSRYDEDKNSKDLDFAMARQIPLDISSFMLLYRFIYKYNLPVLLILLCLYLFGTNYNRDFEKSTSLDFLYTNPIDRGKYYDKKYLVGLLESLKYFAFVLGLILIIGLIFDPRKTLAYPILRYEGAVKNPMKNMDYSSYYTYISLGKYLLEALALSLSLLILLYTFAHSLSVKVKNRYKIYFVMTLVGLILILAVRYLPNIASFNPLAYFSINDVVDGSIAVKKNIVGISVAKGISLMLILSGIIYFVGRKISTRVD